MLEDKNNSGHVMTDGTLKDIPQIVSPLSEQLLLTPNLSAKEDVTVTKNNDTSGFLESPPLL